MNQGGEAAEQIVRMSLSGAEVALKLTGSGAKELAVLLGKAIVLAFSGKKVRGKTRLKSMLKNEKNLKIFAVPDKDLKKFCKEAKKYGMTVFLQAGYMPEAVLDLPKSCALDYLSVYPADAIPEGETLLLEKNGKAYCKKNSGTLLNMFSKEAVAFYIHQNHHGKKNSYLLVICLLFAHFENLRLIFVVFLQIPALYSHF